MAPFWGPEIRLARNKLGVGVPRKKKPVKRTTLAARITAEVRGDPLRMPMKRGHRPKQTTAIHALPESIRVELDSLLASGVPVPAAAAWLARQPGMTDARGRLLVNEQQLYYYRENYIRQFPIAGGPAVARFMRSLGANVDPLLVLQRTVLIQLARVQLQLTLEGKTGGAAQQTGDELDRLDRLLARMFRMKQDMGIIPRAPQQVEARASVTTHGTLATLEMTPGAPVTPQELQQYREALVRGYTDLGVEAAAQELGEDLTQRHKDAKGKEEGQEQKAEREVPLTLTDSVETTAGELQTGEVQAGDDGQVPGAEPGAATGQPDGVGGRKRAGHAQGRAA